MTVGQVIARMHPETVTRRTSLRGARRRPPPNARPDVCSAPAGDIETIPTPNASRSPRSPCASAAAQGVDLGAGARHRPDGRISKADVLAFTSNETRDRPRPRPRPATKMLKGASPMLARYMDESRDIPTATSFRTFTVTVLDQRRKHSRRPVRSSPSRT